jgi:murein DD-endopeptidase MepM/ murein hydrolase activator NlpD
VLIIVKYLVLILFLSINLFASKVFYKEWRAGETFSEYLQEHNISIGLLDSISLDDQKYLSEITQRYKYFELLDNNLTLLQALIPISEVMQIHLFREKNGYGFDIIPIESDTDEYFAHVIIDSNPYTDTLKATQNPKLAHKVTIALRNCIDTRKLKKGDIVDIFYEQPTRCGMAFTQPKIKSILLTTKDGEQNIYIDQDDGLGYTSMQKKIPYKVNTKKKITYKKRVPVKSRQPIFGMPLRHPRVTSSFSLRRWHPILHRYRPHHGTDFGARRGTPLLAVESGKIIYAGWMRGYGKVVKIQHRGGFVSLYAHQSRIRVKLGQRVKKGQIIGYVGSTGRSTGPHLHFGLMKRGRWVNPMKYLGKKREKSVLKTFTKYQDIKITKYKSVNLKDAIRNKEKLAKMIDANTTTYQWQDRDITEVYRYDKQQYE